MSRSTNPGPPDPRTLLQARSGDRPWPGEPAWHRRGGRPPAADPVANVPRPRDPVANVPRPRDPVHPTAVPPAPEPAAEPREPTLVLEVDLREPLPDIAGGAVTRVWMLLRVGGVAVGELLLGVPENGLRGADIGVAIAARIGAQRRGAPMSSDAQPRSRRRGNTSSL
ncbi:hypothetical protein [Jidongwangia harbinensis]|uniref:hypothetical protein n=1 Tax=Jidongwangia harbinensis TaxID=2878561 RepID=UPI001CD9928F|nr:hypothetical protein [Jidongwangia harbinensis]MCA2214831.1 hypothetical protein [Jidongwangia harbinensis]